MSVQFCTDISFVNGIMSELYWGVRNHAISTSHVAGDDFDAVRRGDVHSFPRKSLRHLF